ncbi:MAG: type I DNA topoisomerase [Candidatus Campbellbacteria bacterium]|nr:type I DNA topoisomerase [Candidatus Campbellbacteria bacterium]
MKLLIVESPAKAKTISKYLDGKYKVKASVGHIRDLPKSNKKALDIEGGFVPHYEISKGKEKVVEEIKKLSDKAEEVILATDPDREGEAIAWHISEAAELDNPKRVVFHEITKDAVEEAMENPRTIDIDLKESQEARRVLDRLVGYDLSGLIWKKLRYGLSAGRVQSPALRLIVEREREIRAFEPETYFVLNALVAKKTEESDPFELTATKNLKTKEEVDRVLAYAKKNDWVVEEIQERETMRRPRAPFRTSTLQQTASSRLGFAPSYTMMLAQRLYEAGYITYMRTDSTNLSKQAVAQAREIIKKEHGENYLGKGVFGKKAKGAQEAHESIRPTNLSKKDLGKDKAQKKLYELIRSRTIASQMADAKVLSTKLIVRVGDDKSVPTFAVNGSRTLFPGWFVADPRSRGEDVELPKVKEGEELDLKNIESEEKETQPPSRYSEAGLVKELEKRGIGRPSTYASIIKTIQDRGYVEKEGKTLKPTDTGEIVSEFLEKHFEKYVSDSFTSEMENELDEIAEGKATYKKILSDFYKTFKKDVESKKDIEKITNLGDAPKEFKCPKCGADMIIKLSKSGKFLSCSRFPDCDGARTIEGEEMKGDEKTGEKCPECGGDLVERDGKYGRFVSCSNYPKCKYIKKDEELERKNSTGITCPICNEGFMAEKRGRFGIFYACTNYPKCKHAIKSKPTGNVCTYPREDKEGQPCGALMMEGTKTIPERCSDKNCPNHHPHKLEENSEQYKKSLTT